MQEAQAVAMVAVAEVEVGFLVKQSFVEAPWKKAETMLMMAFSMWS